jgi:hypothetical protein
MIEVGMLVLATMMASLLHQKPLCTPWPLALQRGLLFWGIGVLSLMNAYDYTGLGIEAAHRMGWPAGSPFQHQVAMAHLALGVLGIASEWIPTFRAPTAIGASIFLLGCGWDLFAELLVQRPIAWQAGIELWLHDTTIPVMLLLLTLVSQEASSPTSSKHSLGARRSS